MIRWPWTSLQALNLDWILARMKELIEKVDAYADNVTASATTVSPSTPASVTVTGDLDSGLSFDFTIPRGNTGATGADGPEGPEGPPGESFKILGLVATTGDLPSGAAQGDCYAVGTAASNSCYIWDGSAWVNIGNSMSAAVVSKLQSITRGTWTIKKCGNVYTFHVGITPNADIAAGTTLGTFTFDTDIPSLPSSAATQCVAAGIDNSTPGYPTDFGILKFSLYTTYADVINRTTLKNGYTYMIDIAFM